MAHKTKILRFDYTQYLQLFGYSSKCSAHGKKRRVIILIDIIHLCLLIFCRYLLQQFYLLVHLVDFRASFTAATVTDFLGEVK